MGWATTIKIKQLLTDDESPETAQRTAQAIAAILRKESQGIFLPLLIGADAAFELESIADDMEAAQTCDEVNDTLDTLYDWANDNRVWIGGEKQYAS